MGCFIVLFLIPFAILMLVALLGIAFFGLTLLGIGILGTIPAAIISRTGRSAKWLFRLSIVLMVLGALCTVPVFKILVDMFF